MVLGLHSDEEISNFEKKLMQYHGVNLGMNDTEGYNK